jgi:hypothetical protein
MSTTAFHSAGLAALRRSEDRFARPGILGQLATWFKSQRTADETRALARFAGQRWCDATERQMVGTLSGSERPAAWLRN